MIVCYNQIGALFIRRKCNDSAVVYFRGKQKGCHEPDYADPGGRRDQYEYPDHQ